MEQTANSKENTLVYVDRIPPTLVCPLHLGVFQDPVLGVCGHTFCRSCIEDHIKTVPECPFDRTPLIGQSLFPNRVIVQQLDELLVHCRYGVKSSDGSLVLLPDGCPAQVRRGDRFRHEETCPYKKILVQCAHETDGCQWTGSSSELEEHLRECAKGTNTQPLESGSQDFRANQLKSFIEFQCQLVSELSKIYQVTSDFFGHEKEKAAVSLATLMTGIEGWKNLLLEDKFKQISTELGGAFDSAKANVSSAVGNVRVTFSQWEKQVSAKYSELNILDKILEVSNMLKNQITTAMDDLQVLMEEQRDSEKDEEDTDLKVAMRNSLQTYMDELQHKNKVYEDASQRMIDTILAQNTSNESQSEIGSSMLLSSQIPARSTDSVDIEMEEFAKVDN